MASGCLTSKPGSGGTSGIRKGWVAFCSVPPPDNREAGGGGWRPIRMRQVHVLERPTLLEMDSGPRPASAKCLLSCTHPQQALSWALH